MDLEECHRIAAILLERAASDASPEDIADAVIAILEEIRSALSPIVGTRGVAALLARSLHLVAVANPWLTVPPGDAQMVFEIAAVRTSLAAQGCHKAAEAGGELLQTFRHLLTTFIGPSLTDQLLRSAWVPFSGGPSAQKAH